MGITMNQHSTKRRRIAAWLVLAMVVASTASAQRTNQKLAQAGMKFLSVGLSARQAALADAFTAGEANAVSMLYNPAGMARLGGFADASVGQVNWIADIKHTYVAAAFSPWHGDYGVLGFTVQMVNYGEIEATILANNPQGYLDVGMFKPTAYAVGLGYASALTDRFSVGGNMKLVNQDLGTGIVEVKYVKNPNREDTGYEVVREVKSSLDVVAWDFGVLYFTGYKSLAFGMSVRNFSKEVKYEKESFQLPLTFRIGLSMNMMDLFEMDPSEQSLLLAVDAEHPRDFPEQIKIGAEYSFMDVVAFRVGYVSPTDEHSISYGLGLKTRMAGALLGVDYAYTPFGVFNNVQRLSLRVGF